MSNSTYIEGGSLNMKENLTKEELEKVLPLALEIYTCFFNELTTAVRNSIANFDGAIWQTLDVNAISYYMGKRDAFREIAERLQKEFGLAANYAHYHKFERDFKIARDADIEKVFPSDDTRGRFNYNVIVRHQRALADLLEHYFLEGYGIGSAIKEGKNFKAFNPDEFTKDCIEHLVDPRFRKEKED